LKLYLDRSYMGGGTFGVEAAAQFYFGKSIRDVTLAEAAMLAGLFKAPTRYAPHVNLPASRARANEVLANLVEAGFMTEGQVYGARLNPAKIVERRTVNSPDYFLDWAFEEVQRLAQGKGDFVLTAQTTVDTTLQRAADTAVATILSQHGHSYRVNQSAMVAMEKDGAVRAMVGGADYGTSQFNRATKALRQPGSSFKPYVYLTALEHGYRPSSHVVDGPVGCRVGNRYWSAKNYSGGYRGGMTVATALKKSINTVAVKLSFAVGREAVLANAKKLGLNHVKKSCSMALGDTGLTPLQHTAAYAVFASGGKSVKPYAITEIRNSHNEVIYDHEKDGPKPVQIFNRSVIEELNSILGLVITEGTGRRAQLDFTTAAGKTGTSSSYRDAWFMGFTGQYVAGVWFGNDDFRPTNRVTGGSLPAMAWKQFMDFAHATPNIPRIPGLDLHPKQVEAMERIAAFQNTGPTIGTAANAGRAMAERTQKVLSDIARLLKNAGKISEQDATKASESSPPQKESRTKSTDQARQSKVFKPGWRTRLR
jgi:penicillin-binding protein 1A